MRPLNPGTGKPWPRQRPVDWTMVRRFLTWRQADRDIKAQGFQKVRAFASLPWESPYCTHRITDTAIHPDGCTLYVKTERKS